MRRSCFAALVALFLAMMPAQGDTTNTAPDFKEVFDLIRTHLPGVTESELNQAAVEGLLSALRGKVSIVGTGGGSISNVPAIAVARVMESNVAYVRLAGLDEGLASRLAETIAQWGTTNSLAGLVLDLAVPPRAGSRRE